MGRVISTAIQFIDGFTKPSKEVITNMKKMGNEAIKTGKQIQSAGKVISGVGSALSKSITLPIAGVAVAAVKMSNDFENAMAKVSTIADTTATPMSTLKDQVIDLSNAVGVGVSDIAEAQYQAISAGVDTAQSVNFVSTAVKAAKGGFTDTTTAVNGLTTVLNAYKKGADEATSVSDQMLIAQNFGKTSFGEMAGSMGKVIPIASSLDVSTQELFSSIAVLTKTGIGTSDSITGLKAAFSNILKPSSDAAKYAKSVGLEFNAAHLKSVGWSQMLQEIKEKTGGDTEAMGRLFGSTEALNSVLVLAGKGSEDFATAMEMMQSSTGATQAAYEKMLTPAERMNISINKLKNSLLKFGAAMTPVFSKIADIIGAVGDKLNGLSEGQVNAIVKIAAMAAAVGPVLITFGKMVTAVGKIKATFGTMTKTIANFGGIAKMIASPAGIVIGVLAAIAVAAVLIIKNWDKVKAFLSSVGEWFKNAFENAGFSVEGFKEKFSAIGDTIGGIVGRITGFCKKVAGAFIGHLGVGIAAGAKAAGGALQTLAGGAAAVFDKMLTSADLGLKTFSALVEFFGGAFTGNWQGAALKFQQSLKNIFPPDIADALTKAFNKALPTIVNAVERIKKTIAGIAGAVDKGIKAFNALTDFFGGAFAGNWDSAAQGFRDSLKNIFPSDVAEGLTKAFNKALPIITNTVEGIKKTLTGIADAVNKGIKSFDALTDFFGGAFAGNWDSAAQGFRDSLQNIFPPDTADSLTKAFDKALPFITGIVEGVKSSFAGLAQDAGKVFDSFKSIFGGIGTLIKGIFTGDTEKAFTGFKTACKGVLDTVGNIFKAQLNAIKNFVITALSNFLPESTIKKIALAFDTISETWDAAISVAVNAVKGLARALKPIIGNVKTIFEGLSQFVKGIFTGDWKGALNGLKTVAGGALSALVNIVKAPFAAIGNLIKSAINNFKKLNVVKTVVSAVGNAIKKTLSKSGVDLNKFGSAISNIKTRAGSILNNLKTIFSTVFNAVGKVVRTVANVVANIFGKKISSTCSTAKSAIVAFKVVAGGAFLLVAGIIKKAMAVIVPTVKVAFSAIAGGISAAVSNIADIISGLMTVFDGITTFISGVFTGNWSQAWEGIKTIFSGVFESLVALCKTPINAVIGIINGAISGINNLGLTIPDWVPLIGGKAFSINIPTIPMLYKGTNNWQGGTAMIHDRGGEIVDLPRGSRVYPHDKSVEMARAEGAAKRGSGDISITIQKLADKIEVRSDEDIDRIAEALAIKLKKVVLNMGNT